ncbi:hypothetical protein A4S05_03490 [Nostoc sp. KVJ20]|nr:hypothetical protein A4S05_03490 [Nostoc sp. KVJ20]
MYSSIDALRADSVEEVLKQHWLTKVISTYQIFPHLPLGICSSQKRHRIISLCVKTGFVTSYVDNFSKTLNKCVAASNILNCSISYIDIASKLIVGNFSSHFAYTHSIEYI